MVEDGWPVVVVVGGCAGWGCRRGRSPRWSPSGCFLCCCRWCLPRVAREAVVHGDRPAFVVVAVGPCHWLPESLLCRLVAQRWLLLLLSAAVFQHPVAAAIRSTSSQNLPAAAAAASAAEADDWSVWMRIETSAATAAAAVAPRDTVRPQMPEPCLPELLLPQPSTTNTHPCPH